MDFISGLFNYFSDSQKRLSTRVFWAIFISIAIIIIDNLLGFSYYLQTEKKLDQIDKINNILIDGNLESREILYLTDLREEIIFRKPWIHKVKDFFHGSNAQEAFSQQKLDRESQDQISRNWNIHFITSSWPYILIIAMIVGLGISRIINGKDPVISLLITVIFGFVFFGMALLISDVFSQIPVIGGNPTWNYILNAVINIIPVASFFIYNKDMFKRKVNSEEEETLD